MTPTAKPNGFDPVLAYRQYFSDQLQQGVPGNRIAEPSIELLQARYPNAGKTAPAGSPRDRSEQVLASHYADESLSSARAAFDSYVAHREDLARNGVSLRDYVESALIDDGLGMPPKVAEVLEAEQSAFATVSAGMGLY